jgi:DNA-binding transcriptional ArsR family regulator
MTSRGSATDEEARALASSLRLRILRVCLSEACTNKQIAQALGRDPATTLHHVRRLVRTGFLAAQPERQGTRGAREVPHLATRKSWRLKSPARDRAVLDAFLEEVALVPVADLDTTRLGLRLAPDDMTEFRNRLRDLLDEFEQRPHDPTATPWSLFLAMHPDPSRVDRAASPPERR